MGFLAILNFIVLCELDYSFIFSLFRTFYTSKDSSERYLKNKLTSLVFFSFQRSFFRLFLANFDDFEMINVRLLAFSKVIKRATACVKIQGNRVFRVGGIKYYGEEKVERPSSTTILRLRYLSSRSYSCFHVSACMQMGLFMESKARSILLPRKEIVIRQVRHPRHLFFLFLVTFSYHFVFGLRRCKKINIRWNARKSRDSMLVPLAIATEIQINLSKLELKRGKRR